MASSKLLIFSRPIINALIGHSRARYSSSSSEVVSTNILNQVEDVKKTTAVRKEKEQNEIQTESIRIMEEWIKQKSIDEERARAKKKFCSRDSYFCRCIHVLDMEDKKSNGLMPLTCIAAMQMLEDKKNGIEDKRFLVLQGNRIY